MCGPISSVPVYPKDFLIQTGEKALIKKLKTTKKNSKEWRETKDLLKLPVIHAHEQNNVILPGNGVNIFFLDTEKCIFCVLDGTCLINKHILPEEIKIVLTSSAFGKELIGKKINESGLLNDGTKRRIFLIKNILTPSKSKWPFRY